MFPSIYHAVQEWKSLPSDLLFEKLESLHPGLFTDLLRIEGGGPYPKLALMYIISSYSKESEMLVLGERYGEQKRRIAELLNLPDKLNAPVVMLQSKIVQDVVLSYLDVQQDRKWKHLLQEKEMYEAMMDSSVKSMKREDGNIDFKGMNEAAKNRRELLADIEKIEKQYREEYNFVAENSAEIKKIKASAKGNTSLSVEHSQFIR